MDFNTILNQHKKLIVNNYFELQIAAEKKYGKNTIILIEIGSFYEIYQYDEIGKAREVSKILNILLTKKNKKLQDTNITNPYLCGIPSVTLDKHLDKLMSEEKWTILIVKQQGTPPNITRYVDQVLSPGTTLDFKNEDEYNFIASIFIGKNKNEIYYAGLSMTDLSVGKTLVYESYGTKQDEKIAIDEIEQIIKTHNVKEILFIFEEEPEQEILNTINPENIPHNIQKATRDIINIEYQNKLFENIFNAKGFFSAIEDLDLERMPLATNALSALLTFVIDHNKSIIENLQKPETINSSKYVYLGNNPLQQLNIHSEKESCVSKIINKGVTAIGRRFILEQLQNPIFEKEELQLRYLNSEKFIDNILSKEIEKLLKEIYDIERIWRKIELEKISPFELFNYINSVTKFLEIVEKVKDLDISIENAILTRAKFIVDKVEETFNIEKMAMFNLQNINESFINRNISSELDTLIKELNTIKNKIFLLEKEINKDEKIVSINSTETEGFYIEVTKKKFKENESFILETFKKFFGDPEFKQLKNSIKIKSEELKNLSNSIITSENRVINKVKNIFIKFTKKLFTEENIKMQKEVVKFIATIDFYLNNARLAEKMHYCTPEIIEEDNFYEAIALRHPIVETIEENGLFIPNDIFLGKKELASINTDILFNKENNYLNGFLLYGINSAGKTILTKSIGISIILAQAGFFVPASKLRFSLRKSIFTRISGNDNLQKGLSTFAIEMLELKNIFNRASENSLVLGDEISHGTETISGMSIVASTIIQLVKKNTLFALSTHLHQLEDIKDIKDLKTVTNVHLSIKYDKNKDILIYDRKLKPGNGSSVYGLEFATSLKLPEDFINRAYKYRDEIAPDLSEEKRLVKNKKSRYNSKVFVTSCAVCGKEARETHHIKEQHKSLKGFVENTRLNHKFNLLPLCNECHDKVHEGKLKINGFIKTSEGIELSFEKII